MKAESVGVPAVRDGVNEKHQRVDGAPQESNRKSWVTSIFTIERGRSIEERDFLITIRVMFVLGIFITLAWLISIMLPFVGINNKPGELNSSLVFLQSMPMLIISGLFGILGSATRFLVAEKPSILKRQYRNMVCGGIVGAVAFMVIQSKVISNLVYESPDQFSGLSVDPFGTLLVSFVAGMFAPELVGYANQKMDRVVGGKDDEEKNTVASSASSSEEK